MFWVHIWFALEQKAPHQVSQTAPTLFTDDARKKTSVVVTKVASCALNDGNTKRVLTWAACKAKPIAKAPRTWRNSPVKDSSRTNSCCANTTSSKSPRAEKNHKAMGKSKPPETFGKSADPKLT